MTHTYLRRFFRFRDDDCGQAIVEFALVSVLLFTLLFGGLDFGRALNAWAVVTHASREGARVASTQCAVVVDCSVPVQSAIEGALAGLNVPDVRWEMDGGPYVSGGPVNVHIEYDVVPIIPLIAVLMPGGMLTVSGDTTMRLE
jgi:Flp pilus assembly pilin Flp